MLLLRGFTEPLLGPSHQNIFTRTSQSFLPSIYPFSTFHRASHLIGDAGTPLCGLVINTARSEQRQYHYHSDSSIPSDSAIVLGALGFPAYQKYFVSSGQNAKRRSLPAQALTTSKHLYESNTALDVVKRLIARIGARPDPYLR